MSQNCGKNNNTVYKLVLTGGPCGGKTTGQARLCSFFENIGWKVYRVPETATLLQGGGVKFSSLTKEEAYTFQRNLLYTMVQIENTFFELAASCKTSCLVICDRGAMDASAYLDPADWERMKEECGLNEVDLRDSRYNQVVHLISAAQGAEAFYHLDNNDTRSEGVNLARHLDNLTSQAWVGHPYFDVIDNSTDFERKMVRMIAAVCNRLGIEARDRLALDSRKRKFLVKGLPEDLASPNRKSATERGSSENGTANTNVYPQFQDFIVVHDYLVTPNQKSQARIRRRGQNVKWDENKGQWNLETGHWTYMHTIRSPTINEESPELKVQISSKEYKLLLAQRDTRHYTIYKKRRCFLWNNTYYQMDIYQQPCHERCHGLIILETYTSQQGDALQLPDFLDIVGEVTRDSYYSMYNLSCKDSSPDALKSLSDAKLARRHDSRHGNNKENSSTAVVNGHGMLNGHTA